MRLIDADKIEWYGCDFEDCEVCIINEKNCNVCTHASCEHNQVANLPTVNAIVIPDNATNGDVIKALFPNEHDFETDFDEDWWNALYKKGGTE